VLRGERQCNSGRTKEAGKLTGLKVSTILGIWGEEPPLFKGH